MSTEGLFRTSVSLVLVLFLVVTAIPVSAADFSSRNVPLGSVSGVGEVQLRGFAVNHEGTLFAGDSVRSGAKSYAKVILGNGNKVELFSDTRCIIDSSNQQVRVNFTAGNMGFANS